jgi:hypothetical protein
MNKDNVINPISYEKTRDIINEKYFRDTSVYARYIFDTLTETRDCIYNRESLTQFLMFAAPLARRSQGQLFQDLWALWEAGVRRGGYFVEFGVANGVRLSNSYILETEFGWDGVVAEPNPIFIPLVKKARKCRVSDKCVFSHSGEKIAFLPTRSGELSRIKHIVPEDFHERDGKRIIDEKQEVMVDTISLNDLLIQVDAPNRIDYISVDTEGSEYEILSAFDFDRWDVRSISVEHNKTPLREKLYELLVNNGYRRKWPELSQFDDWYVRD